MRQEKGSLDATAAVWERPHYAEVEAAVHSQDREIQLEFAPAGKEVHGESKSESNSGSCLWGFTDAGAAGIVVLAHARRVGISSRTLPLGHCACLETFVISNPSHSN